MHLDSRRRRKTAAGKLFLGFWLAFGAAQLHAGFIGTSCTAYYASCVAGNINTSVQQGTTTFTFDDTLTGGLVGGLPTLGSRASLEVSDPNGVPASSQVSMAYETFTDTIPISSAALFYTFTLDFHVNNSLNSYAQGFPSDYSELFLVVTARDATQNILWHTTNFDFSPVDVITPGSSDRTVTYTTNFSFYNPATASLDISLTSTSLVGYANSNPHTNATDVLAFSDASHTITLESVQGQSFGGVAMGPLLYGQSGANYSGQPLAPSVPEPSSFGFVLLGGIPLLLRARQRRQRT
jgi:hypothetical protein